MPVEQLRPRAHIAVPLGISGFVLLLLTLLRTGALALGDGLDKLFVLLIVGALVILALIILSLEGCPPTLVWACLLPVALAFFLRIFCLDHVTNDYDWFLSRWVQTFRDSGGFAGLSQPIGNYNVPYLYFLAFFSYLPFPDLYAIKLLSLLSDVMLAWGGLRLAKTLCPPDSRGPAAAFCALLLLPTVILNGAYWGQCDSLYSALAFHALASALGRRPVSSVVYLAAAFSFKLQAVFLIPLWRVFWYTGRVKLRHLCLFPAVCGATLAPALLLGKPLGDILAVYLNQAGSEGQHTTLNFNSPSVFGFLPYGSEPNQTLLARLGIAAAFLFVLLLLALLFRVRDRMDEPALFTAAIVMAVGVPFFLPYMHERYFFLADALTLVWACVSLKRVFQVAAVQTASLGGYHAYLVGRYFLPVRLLGLSFAMGLESLLMLAALLASAVALVRQTGRGAPSKRA
ncbi:MAG: conjugal transfer protein TraL [Clostridiales bacterium]|nr:conjugal transfer protein TraL [Clostridiales bacterium]